MALLCHGWRKVNRPPSAVIDSRRSSVPETLRTFPRKKVICSHEPLGPLLRAPRFLCGAVQEYLRLGEYGGEASRRHSCALQAPDPTRYHFFFFFLVLSLFLDLFPGEEVEVRWGRPPSLLAAALGSSTIRVRRGAARCRSRTNRHNVNMPVGSDASQIGITDEFSSYLRIGKKNKYIFLINLLIVFPLQMFQIATGPFLGGGEG